jgi:hypothetical protein
MEDGKMDITGIGSIFDFGSKVIDKIFPDKDAADRAKLEMMKLQQQGAFKEMELAFEAAKGQMEINKAEAANQSVFVSGWRPAVGWVCVAAYCYNYVAMPLIVWATQAYASFMQLEGKVPSMITLDTGELTTLLFGMLGIGALRTVEKLKGKATS